jgi:hypothetical protein
VSPLFRLEKLYLDCIDESGNCFIIYLAKLRISVINLNYCSVIFSDSNGVTTEKSALKKMVWPVQSGILDIAIPDLQISGRWKSIDDPISSLLFSKAAGREVYWNCHHPKAAVEIIYHGKVFKGLGYAETLSLSIQPWKLPVEELRWGRFLSESQTVTWINWKGSNPVNRIFCNETEFNDAIFEEDRIIFGDGVYLLTFDEISVIRDGKLSNVLSGMDSLNILFNNRILNTVEVKYKAKSSLHRNSELTFGGQALYEIVTWGK